MTTKLHQDITQIIVKSLEKSFPPIEPLNIDALDSIQKLSLLIAIEDHYGILLQPEQNEPLHTLSDLVAAVAKRLNV